MSNVEFNDSVENIESSINYSYLLNFWHVSKLNKEYEFIKRHGIHPKLITTINNGINDMKVPEGNGVSTAFYTAFRIFLKGLFNGADAFKSRDVDEWKITYTDKQSHFDDLTYLIYKFNENDLPNNVIKSASRRYGLKGNESFMVKLSDRDQVHAKLVLDDFNSMHEKASDLADGYLTRELEDLTKKIARICEIENPANNKKTIKKPMIPFDHPQQRSIWESVENVQPRPTITQIPSPALIELLPIWHQIKNGINTFPPRTKFSYLLNFAKQGSTNIVVNNIQDTETNFSMFMTLTEQMTA